MKKPKCTCSYPILKRLCGDKGIIHNENCPLRREYTLVGDNLKHKK